MSGRAAPCQGAKAIKGRACVRHVSGMRARIRVVADMLPPVHPGCTTGSGEGGREIFELGLERGHTWCWCAAEQATTLFITAIIMINMNRTRPANPHSSSLIIVDARDDNTRLYSSVGVIQ